MEWLQANWLPLAILAGVVIVFIIHLVKISKEKGLRQTALEAILKAEEQYNSTTGQERMKLAVEYVYASLPDVLKIAFTKDIIEKYLTKFIQKVFDEVKAMLTTQRKLVAEIAMIKKGA